MKRKKLSRGLRISIYTRDGWACRYCGLQFDKERTFNPTSIAPYIPDDRMDWIALEIDHIHPLYLGGTNEPENLCAACSRCNRKKSFRAPKRSADGLV